MNIEHFQFGMINGKIETYISPGLYNVLSDESFEFLRRLKPSDSGVYFWLPTEQVLALPYVIKTEDQAGRTFTWNHTLLIKLHDYIQYTNPYKLFDQYFVKQPIKPVNMDAITISSTPTEDQSTEVESSSSVTTESSINVTVEAETSDSE